MIWIFRLGQKKNICARLFVFVVRNIFFVFFIQYQTISFTEQGSHNIAMAQRNLFKASYALSIIFSALTTIELARAWVIVSRGYSLQELNSKDIDLETKWIFKSWTFDIEPRETLRGNTLMVCSRIRWSIILACTAGLYSFNVG